MMRMHARSFSDCGSDELDALAAEATLRWQDHAVDGPDEIEGIDAGALTRVFLWDKVARAIRRRCDPARAAPEVEAVRRQGRAPARTLGALRNGANAVVEAARRVRRNVSSARLLAPEASPHLRRTIAALARRGSAVCFAPEPPFEYAGSESLARTRARSVARALDVLGWPLLDVDVVRLQDELREQHAVLLLLGSWLRLMRPDTILLPGDNFHPMLECALVARREEIPAIALQHGLDCERYVYDEAYASHLAVWGCARADRYRRSATRAAAIHVTGAPELDHLRVPESIDDVRDG